jgi:hypothetical protein
MMQQIEEANAAVLGWETGLPPIKHEDFYLGQIGLAGSRRRMPWE